MFYYDYRIQNSFICKHLSSSLNACVYGNPDDLESELQFNRVIISLPPEIKYILKKSQQAYVHEESRVYSVCMLILLLLYISGNTSLSPWPYEN